MAALGSFYVFFYSVILKRMRENTSSAFSNLQLVDTNNFARTISLAFLCTVLHTAYLITQAHCLTLLAGA